MTLRSLSLTNRLLLVFLGTAALVLCGFSIAIYALARGYLYGQLDVRLSTTINTVSTLVEAKSDGVLRKSKHETVSFSGANWDGGPEWLMTDDHEHIVDGSPGAITGELAAEVAAIPMSSQSGPGLFHWKGQHWQIAGQWIRSNPRFHDPEPPDEKLDLHEVKHLAVQITAGIPLEPVHSALRQLRLGLVVVSGVVWISALFVGRSICRRTLAPVTRVAQAAEGMSVLDLGERLERTGAGDELDGLIDSFNGLLDRLQQSFDRQQRFVGDASHQLRTPLTSILGQIEVALRRPRTVEEHEQSLASVHRQAVHLGQIVESLLYLARADAEADLPGLEQIDLQLWVRQHLDSWSSHPRSNDLQLADSLVGPCRINSHPVLLAELMNNLLDNALKYSLPGTPVVVRVECDTHESSVSVTDQGNGIREADLPHLFDPFFRSEESRLRGINGVGLGLTIAARLAQALRGQIIATSVVGTGSCFAVRFPNAPPDS